MSHLSHGQGINAVEYTFASILQMTVSMVVGDASLNMKIFYTQQIELY